MAHHSAARPTIADVAQAAGVSKSTVSRVLMDNTEYMRDETRLRVEQAIKLLNYSPSTVARSLVTKRTLTVGLLVSDVANPFYPEVIHNVEDVALEHHYDVFLCNTNYSPERGLQIIRSLIAKQVDGVMIMSSGMSDEWVKELVESQIPSVVLDWQVSEYASEISTIKVDFDSGVTQAVEHLTQLGHRHFAHVSGPLNMRTSILRREAFLNALAKIGIESAQVPVIEGNLRIDCGRRVLAELLSLTEPPTAIFTANDLTAMGIIWAAREAGLQIPQDLSVIGLDNIKLSAEIHPPLTTVALPQAEIGQLAMINMIKLLNSDRFNGDAGCRCTVNTSLIVRESTTTPRSRRLTRLFEKPISQDKTSLLADL